MTANPSVLIVGAGMAGLTCAVYLKKAGIDARVLEASDGVGGRVRTDAVDGFRLDRGFQILLTAYPEARRLLDYPSLRLQTFRSGALIRHKGDWMTLLDPMREPTGVFQTLFSPVGTLSDKLRVVELQRKVAALDTNEFFHQSAIHTEAYLEDFGYSDQIIERFFRPFFGGVFLENDLSTSSNFFEFCFKCFNEGDAAIPAAGMQAIPDQLAGRLSPDQIQLNTTVEAVNGQTVRLRNGQTLTADRIVLAVDARAAGRLLGRPDAPAFNHTTCTYFAAPRSPKPEKLLMLNTDRQSAVHNVAILSDVAPEYAPEGRALISVSTQGLEVVNVQALTERIRKELTEWFGDEVAAWRWLRTYHLPEALPQYSGNGLPHHAPLRLSDTLYQCGDQAAYPSLNAAMQTGRKVAEMILKGV